MSVSSRKRDQTLERVTFSTPRAAEFLEVRALQGQTGQTADRFGDVVVKELIDNALDAAETAGNRPKVEIRIDEAGEDRITVTITDNGPGIPAEVVDRILDFDVLVSDKAAYRSMTRGLQGNAWKTILGINSSLEVSDPVVIEAHGIRHEVAVYRDPGGNVVVHHDRGRSRRKTGTKVVVPLPADLEIEEERWARGFAVVNPHASIRFGRGSYLAHDEDSTGPGFYKSTAGDGWRKPLPTDKTSPHWYDSRALEKLIFAHIGAGRNGSPDVPLGDFIRSFQGLSSTTKAKAVASAVPGVRHLSDFEDEPDRIDALLEAMKIHAKEPKPHRLGSVGEDHFKACFQRWYGVERHWYKRVRTVHEGMPWVLEVAVAATESQGQVFYAANYSPTFEDALGSFPLDSGEVSTTGAESFLRECDAFPDWENDYLRAAVVHVICPGLEFTDKGKTRIGVPR